MKKLRSLFPLLCLATSLAAQQPTAPSDSVLAGITARGRLLVQYDIAAWHAGDALGALNPKAGEINAAVARTTPNSRWEVLYGLLTTAKDTFWVRFRAVQTDADSAFTAERYTSPIAFTGVEREMAVALQTATTDFGPVTRPYNSYVLPGGRSSLWVFLLPAQTDPRVFPHGGDARYRISEAGTKIADKAQLHRTILNFPTAVPAGVVSGTHTSFDSLPSETDVFLVLRRFPRLKEIVRTDHFIYEIHLDGTISWMRAGQP